jgi:hypothetical protein
MSSKAVMFRPATHVMADWRHEYNRDAVCEYADATPRSITFALARSRIGPPLRAPQYSAQLSWPFAVLAMRRVNLVKSAAELILNDHNHCLLHPFGGPGIVLASRECGKACTAAKETLAQLDQQLSGNLAQYHSRTPAIGEAIAAFVVA